MSGFMFTNGNYQAIGNDGLVVPLGTLKFTFTSTGLDAITYKDSALTIANDNPILLSSSGKADVFLADGIYDIVLKDANGAVIDSAVGFKNDLSNISEKLLLKADIVATAVPLDTLADLRALDFPYPTVRLSGYHTKNDGAYGSNIFRLKGVKTTEIDYGGTIIIVTINAVDYVYELESQKLHITYFGAIAYDTKAEAVAGQDSYFAFENAIKSLATIGGTIELPLGYVKTLSTIQDDITAPTESGKPILLIGQGASEVDGEGSIILTQGAMTGILFDGNRSGGRDFKIEGDGIGADTTSHGIVSNSSRAQWDNIVSSNHRGQGVLYRFGNNAKFSNITCLSNGSHGFNADGTGYLNKAGASRPNDLNAAVFINIDSRANGNIGFRTGANSGFSNFILGLTVQGNAGVGAEFNGNYYRVFGFYGEANDSSGTNKDIRFSATADFNRIYGDFSNVAPAWEDLSALQKNYIDQYKFQSEEIHVQEILMGEDTNPAGYLKFSGLGDGINTSITLEGTSATQQIDISSNGAGELGINPDFIARETIIAPTLLNSWVNFGGSRRFVGFWKDKFNVVHIEGIIKSGVTVNPTPLFMLPVGYRPAQRERFATVANGALGSLFIDSDGNVYYETGSNVEFSLCGITFRV